MRAIFVLDLDMPPMDGDVVHQQRKVALLVAQCDLNKVIANKRARGLGLMRLKAGVFAKCQKIT